MNSKRLKIMNEYYAMKIKTGLCNKRGFRKSAIALAVALAGSQLVYAQSDELETETVETETAELQREEQEADRQIMEEVLITGFRTSLISSIDAKRNADSIVESISASDIGGLPDVSIADALARVPGLTTNRSGGQAGDIQIRGLSDEFVFSTLGGREQVSPNLRRTIEFNQYPSELISRVTIYKSPKASLIEGGVAGTVDLDVANPLEMRDKRKLQVNARYSYNDRAGDVKDAEADGYRVSLSWQEKFFDDKFGVSLGYAGLKQPNVAVQYVGGRPQATEINLSDGSTQSVFMPDEFELYQIGGEENRDGYLVAFQFEPTDQLSMEADFFYSEFTSDSIKRGVSINTLRTATISNPVIQNGNLTSALFSSVYNQEGIGNGNIPNVRVVQADVTDNDDIFSGGFNISWNNDVWSAELDISHSNASGYNADGFNIANLYRSTDETNAFPTGFQREYNEQVHWQTNGLEIPNVAFSRDYTDYDALRLTEYGRYPRINEDEVSAVRMDFGFQLDKLIFTRLEAGVRLSERQYDYRRQVFIYNGPDTPPSDVDLPITPATGEVYDFGGEYSHFPDFIAFDGEALLQYAVDQGLVLSSGRDIHGDFDPSQFNLYGELIPRSTEPAAKWSRDWSVRQRGDVAEDVLAYYLMANIATEIFDLPVSGNIGVRVVETDQSSVGLYNVLGDPELGAVEVCDEVGVCLDQYAYIRSGTAYTNTLPSLNLNFEITGNDYLRFAAARVMSRPPINQLSSDQPVDGGGGNSIDYSDPLNPKFNFSNTNSPFLKPFLADQVDLSYEHYFEDGEGLVAIALYHKEIKSFIQTATIQNFDFREAGFLLPDTVQVEIGGLLTDVPLQNGDYTFSINNKEGGYIQGVELSYTKTLGFLPEPWDGLGVTASAAFVDSEITVDNPFTPDAGDSLPYPGLAERSGNITLFYEYEGFETRVSANYQSDKVGEIGTAFAANTVFAPETIIDFQASYEFGMGLSAVFQAKNLTDEVNASYWGREDIVGTIQHFGRQYFLGLNYAF